MADIPPALRAALDEVVAEGTSVARLQPLVDEMQSGYRAEGSHERPLIDTPEKAIAYAAYRLPGTFAAITRVFQEASRTIPGLMARTMIDVGGGSGSGAWAAAVTLPGLVDISILDRSESALALGARLAVDGPPPLPGADWRMHHIGSPLPDADLALAAYLLGELAPTEQAGLLERMAGSASTLVIVEPGTPPGFRRVVAARQTLLDLGLSVAAPCPHEERCPLLDGDWCHFSARFDRPPVLRKLKRADHGYEDEKFSYLVATRLPVERPDDRVIRHPQFRGKMVALDLCRSDGTASGLVVTKSQGAAYRRARKTRWGDAWS